MEKLQSIQVFVTYTGGMFDFDRQQAMFSLQDKIDFDFCCRTPEDNLVSQAIVIVERPYVLE